MTQEEIIKKLRPAFAKLPVRLAYLYGSYATDETHPKSDIDIAVVWSEGIKMFGFKIAPELQEALGSSIPEIDVRDISLNTEPVFLANVLKPAKPIFARSEKERIRFEVTAWKNFWDTQHSRDIFNYYMYKRIKEGKYGRGTPNYQKTA
ncbi:MAG: nucleotidyltransferase domain-containing protein [Candidatus Blackburnbacteria bacterium]|nr:nucleotidyltransferase domain-containing protein [Candidatus Blackburnbacteria bacterium]